MVWRERPLGRSRKTAIKRPGRPRRRLRRARFAPRWTRPVEYGLIIHHHRAVRTSTCGLGYATRTGTTRGHQPPRTYERVSRAAVSPVPRSPSPRGGTGMRTTASRETRPRGGVGLVVIKETGHARARERGHCAPRPPPQRPFFPPFGGQYPDLQQERSRPGSGIDQKLWQ